MMLHILLHHYTHIFIAIFYTSAYIHMAIWKADQLIKYGNKIKYDDKLEQK